MRASRAPTAANGRGGEQRRDGQRPGRRWVGSRRGTARATAGSRARRTGSGSRGRARRADPARPRPCGWRCRREASPVAITHRPVPTTRTAKDSSEVIIRVKPPWAARRVPRRTTSAMTGRVASSGRPARCELTRCNDGGASGSGCEDQGDVDGAVPGRSRHWSEQQQRGQAGRGEADLEVLSSGPALQRRGAVRAAGKAERERPVRGRGSGLRHGAGRAHEEGQGADDQVRQGASGREGVDEQHQQRAQGRCEGREQAQRVDRDGAALRGQCARCSTRSGAVTPVHLPGRAEPRVARRRWRATAAGPDRSRPARARGGRPLDPRVSTSTGRIAGRSSEENMRCRVRCERRVLLT